MNRRFVVLGLAVAMFGSVVVGQTAQKDAPPLALPSLDGLPSLDSITPRLVQAQKDTLRPLAQVPPTTVAVQTTVRVESVGPELMRLRIATDGVEHVVLESVSFTVTNGVNGTTISASGPGTLASSDGMKHAYNYIEVRLGANGPRFTVRR